MSQKTDFHTLFHFLMFFPASRGTIFDGVRALLRKVASSAFCTKSYYPLVGGASPIPLNKLIAWLRNSYESLYFAVRYFFKNEKRGDPISLKLTDTPLELSSDIVFSDTFLLKNPFDPDDVVDIVCNLYPFAACSLIVRCRFVRLDNPDPVPMNFSVSTTCTTDM